MSSASTHLALVKPVGADAVSVLRTSIGSNADTVDAAIGRVAAGLQEGVIDAGSFMVTQKGAGANMSVDVASNTGTGAYVQDDGVTGQGLYYVVTTGSATNVAIGTAHATLPRIDRVVAGLDGTVAVVAGTATTGATLNNLTGAAGVPASKLLLADVLVAATVTTIPNTVIRDRRKWARGSYWRALSSSGGDITAAGGGTFTVLDSTNLQARVECSGVPLRATLHGVATCGASSDFELFVDGAVPSPRLSRFQSPIGSGASIPVDISWTFVPSAGSHLFAPAVNNGAVITRSTTYPVIFEVEEIVRQNSANNTTTTG